jgi:hypothetical protein
VSKSTLLAFTVCAALAACSRKPSPEQSSEASPAAATPSVSAPEGVSRAPAPKPADPKPLSIGPAPPGDPSATLESRRQAVRDLLFGGAQASHLGREAVEPGASFNPKLRDVVAPAGPIRPPKVRMGETEVKGDMAPVLVQRMVRQQFGRFRMCYEAELVRNPIVEGRVELRFQIDEQGSIQALSVRSDVPVSLRDCVKAAVSSVVFPKPPGTVQVVYPILFSPG